MKTNQKNTLIYTLLIIFSAGLVSCQSKKSGFEFIQNLYEEAAPLVDEQSKLDDIVSKNSGEITLTNLYVDHEGNVLFGDDLFPKRDTTKYDPNNKEKKYYYTSFYVVPYSTIDGKIVAIWNLRASLSATTILSSVPWTKPIANVHAYVELYVPEELKPKMAEIYYPARLSEEIFVPNLTYNQGNTDTRDIIFATTEISAKVKLREIKKGVTDEELRFCFELIDIVEVKKVESENRKKFEEYYSVDWAKERDNHNMSYGIQYNPVYLKQKKPIVGTFGQYTGEIVFGKPNGKGKVGNCEGQWKDGLMDSHIVWFLSDSTKFEGEFTAGKPVTGQLSYVQGFVKSYTGNFGGYSEDVRFTTNDATDYASKATWFIKNGSGKEIYADSSYYDGEWANNMKVKGMFVWPDGQKYEGEFVNNNIGGKGKLTAPDGKIIWEK